MQPAEVSGVDRARWLAELAAALNEARALVSELAVAEGRTDALELYAHIEALRLEIKSLQLRKSPVARREISPERTKLPWLGYYTGTWN